MILRDKAKRQMIRDLVADRANVLEACRVAGAAAYEAPEVRRYFKTSNRTFAEFLPSLFDNAALCFGEAIARQVCATYGDGHSPDTVKADKLADTFAQFVRLVDPMLIEPRPAVKLAPVVVSKPLEARIAKLEFAALKAANADKADRLRRKLRDAVAPFASVSALYDLNIWYVPPQADDYLAFGLTRMTVGTFAAPCLRGLGELETFLRLPVGSKTLHNMADRLRTNKATLWDDFERFAKARLATLDGEEYDRLCDAFYTAKGHGRNLYPWAAADWVFEDKRNAPDATLDEFAQMGRDFVKLEKDWFAAIDPPEPEPLRATARIIEPEFG